MKFYNWL